MIRSATASRSGPATSGSGASGSSTFPGGGRERQLDDLREPLSPDRGIAAGLAEVRVERPEVEQRLVDIEHDDSAHVTRAPVSYTRASRDAGLN